MMMLNEPINNVLRRGTWLMIPLEGCCSDEPVYMMYSSSLWCIMFNDDQFYPPCHLTVYIGLTVQWLSRR